MNVMPIEDSDKNEDVIEWSKDYFLSWDDFQRETPIELQAESAVGFKRKFTDTVIFEKDGKMMFRIICEGVLCFFNQKNSWVSKKQMVEPYKAMILKHEQGHFDLMKIYAIQNEDKIQKLCNREFVCLGNSSTERKAFSEKEGKKLLDEIHENIFEKARAETKRYNEITNHGLITSEQEKFDAQFAQLREKK